MVCILVVEDEDLIRLIMVEELVEAGFAVREAENGDRAAALIEDPLTTFDLLVTDIHMPGRLDGIAVARLMRAWHPEAPIIYTTGRPDVMATAGGLRENDALLAKPYTPSKLMGVVKRVLGDGWILAGG